MVVLTLAICGIKTTIPIRKLRLSLFNNGFLFAALNLSEKRVAVLTTRSAEIAPWAKSFSTLKLELFERLLDLEDWFEAGDVLLAHNTNQIVPSHLLQKASMALNIHAGPPEFPGRDPHHWAVYRQAKEYGITAHFMEEKVDAGDIIEAIRFPIEPLDTPLTLLQKANDLALNCMADVLKRIDANQPLLPIPESWAPYKTRRRDFLEICDVTEVRDDVEEMQRRIKAFHVPGHQNLYYRIGNERVYLFGRE